MEFMKSWGKIFLALAIALWLATGCAIISRVQLVFDYSTLSLVPPEYEVIAGSASAIAALMVLISTLVVLWFFIANSSDAKAIKKQSIRSSYLKEIVCWLATSLPLLVLALRIVGWEMPPPGWWELAWFAGWTGVATRSSLPNLGFSFSDRRWPWYAFLTVAVVGCTWWWLWQSMAYHAGFQLGFNDFGHFTQRISSTANSYGILLESPVLPPFWDHFNPGLLLLVPLWNIYPHVELIFTIQAVCLAGSAGLVAAIARSRKQSAFAACVWGCVWLLTPSTGQMNLAYTYGWHPITLAIPCLLAAYLLLIRGRVWIAVAFAFLASSFEEGVIVVIGCFAATQTLRIGLQKWQLQKQAMPISRQSASRVELEQLSSLRGWLIVTCVSVISFILVYQFSGLAPFQTGRFAKLGSNLTEIMASPISRPDVFWGLLFRPRNLAFVALIVIPFAVAGSLEKGSRDWLWSLVAICLPVFVLLIWEHLPAQSLAFQYTSCLLPVLFVGVIETATKTNFPEGRALGMLAAAWVLSISIGQMPWSNDSLGEVKGKTYGLQPDPKTRSSRVYLSEDAEWITQRIRSLKPRLPASYVPASGIEKLPDWKNLRVLATGRLAAHFVGVRELETVSQFWQRYDSLQALDHNLASPILRYDVMFLDLRETFQQTLEETAQVMIEAEKNGWTIHEQNFDFVVLVR